MLKQFLLKWKLKKSALNTKRQLESRLCDYRNPFSADDLYTLYRLLKLQEAPLLMSPDVDGRTISVYITENKVDWFSFRIRYSVPTFDISVRIQVFAGAPQVGSCECDTIHLTIEYMTGVSANKRGITERNFDFINAISIECLDIDKNMKTPAITKDVTQIKRILAKSFKIAIDYLIDWRRVL